MSNNFFSASTRFAYFLKVSDSWNSTVETGVGSWIGGVWISVVCWVSWHSWVWNGRVCWVSSWNTWICCVDGSAFLTISGGSSHGSGNDGKEENQLEVKVWLVPPCGSLPLCHLLSWTFLRIFLKVSLMVSWRRLKFDWCCSLCHKILLYCRGYATNESEAWFLQVQGR